MQACIINDSAQVIPHITVFDCSPAAHSVKRIAAVNPLRNDNFVAGSACGGKAIIIAVRIAAMPAIMYAFFMILPPVLSLMRTALL